MRSVALLLALPLVSAACSTNPCDGKGPVCISVRVEGSTPALDGINLTATLGGGTPLRAQNRQAPINLPVRFAVILPTASSGRVTLEVDGVAGSAIIASGSGALTVPPSGQKITITLNAASVNGDLAGSGVDIGGGDLLACTPSPPSVCAATDCGKIQDPTGCGVVDCGPCQAYAIDQPLAIDGSTIAVEGKFHGATTVSFPGSATTVTPLTVGPARLTAVVPADATQGLLQVTSNGSTTAGLWFHRAPFTPAIGRFRRDYEQTEIARNLPILGTGGFGFTRVGRFMYGTGGSYSVGGNVVVLDGVTRITVNADGSMGVATTSAFRLPAPRNNHTAVAAMDRLFILGGSVDAVWSAQIGADGTLGRFTDTGVVLQRNNVAANIIGNSVYAFGGSDPSGVGQLTVMRSVIQSDGTLGAFAPASSTLAERLTGAIACVRGERVYVFGGSNSETAAPTANIESAAINSDGTLGPFTIAGQLQQARGDAQCLTLDGLTGAIYVYGGGLASVEHVTIAADGGISGVTTEASTLTLANPGARGAVLGSTLHVVGGGVSGTATVGLGQQASLDGSGNLDNVTQITPTQTIARSSHAAVVIGNWLYLIGGDPGPPSGGHPLLDSVERAPIAADGTLGAFVDISAISKLKVARAGHVLAVAGPFIYAIGGATDTAGTATNTVERASIDPVTGTLSAFDFVQDANAKNIVLTTPRAGAAAWFSGHTLYVAGGHGTAAQKTIDQVSVKLDNTLAGQFTLAPFDLGVEREHFKAAVLNGNVDAIGGFEVSGPSANVYVSSSGASFSSAGALLGTPRADFALTLVGETLYALGGRTTTLLAGIVSSSINANEFFGAFGSQGMVLPTAVGQAAFASAGDWFYILGGVDSSGVRQGILSAARK